MPVTLQCQHCGNEFSVIPAVAKTAKFCSWPCKQQAQIGKRLGADHPRWIEGAREKVCQNCGDLFQKHPRRAMSLFVKQKFCCKPCADEGGFRYFGEENPKWNGNPRRKHPGRHAAWARKVISRDGATCQKCGTTGVEMHAHHVKPYIEHPDLRWDVSNGETLCYECHWNEHTGSTANGVNSGKLAAGQAGDNPEPSFGRKPVEGVTTRGRAYRRWEGSCEWCGEFLSKRWSDVKAVAHVFCSNQCKGKYSAANRTYRVWKDAPKVNGSNASTSALPERDDIV
jgi:hypothetical protein